MLHRSYGKLAALLVVLSAVYAVAGPISLLLGTTDKHGIVSNASTSYLLVSGSKGTSTTEADVTEGLPPGTLSKLACWVDQQPTPGTLAITVRVGAADTSITCTIGALVVRCNDMINTAAVGADPRVAIKVVPSSSPSVGQLSCHLFFNRT